MIDQSIFKPYMQLDEYLLWCGKPDRIHILGEQDVILIPFSLLWLAFSLFWEWQAIAYSDSLLMVLWGLPFIAIGLYLLFFRLIHQAYLLKHTAYAITNRQLIIIEGRRVHFYTPANLPPAMLKVHRDGTGSLLFYESYYRNGRTRTLSYGMKYIRDYMEAQRALGLLQEEFR